MYRAYEPITGLWSLRPSNLRIPRSSSVSYFRHTTSPLFGGGGGGGGCGVAVPGESAWTCWAPSLEKNGRNHLNIGADGEGDVLAGEIMSSGLDGWMGDETSVVDAEDVSPTTGVTVEMVFAWRMGTPLPD